MYRTPPKRTPRVAAIVARRQTAALVVLDPWEIRVAMVAPVATVRLALLREHPTAVATDKHWPWLRRAGPEIVILDSAAEDPILPDQAELRRFAGMKHESLLRRALALADQILTQALHDQTLSENRSRSSPGSARADAPAGAPRRVPVSHSVRSRSRRH
jgi:hypothetical protein